MIRNLWLEVKNSRTKFEQRPDDGIEIRILILNIMK